MLCFLYKFIYVYRLIFEDCLINKEKNKKLKFINIKELK